MKLIYAYRMLADFHWTPRHCVPEDRTTYELHVFEESAQEIFEHEEAEEAEQFRILHNETRDLWGLGMSPNQRKACIFHPHDISQYQT